MTVHKSAQDFTRVRNRWLRFVGSLVTYVCLTRADRRTITHDSIQPDHIGSETPSVTVKRAGQPPRRTVKSQHAPFLTPSQLAACWGIDQKEIVRRIESGELQALRFGARLFRVRTADALAYEKQHHLGTSPRGGGAKPARERKGKMH